MNFLHETVDIPGQIKQINTSGKRLYETPDGNFPSITTVLSSLSKAGIQAWRKRVGEEEANRISTQASRRGTRTHSIIEDYLKNQQDYLNGYMPDSIELFQSIQSILNTHIGKIYGLEVSLWSKYLGVAGRCDCIAEYDDEISIIDWKTSSKPKKEEWIESYKLQGTGYAKMYEERTGIKVSQVVIVIAVVDGTPQVFYANPDEHVERLQEVINNY
jgi:genome maintenance exonuclease 1|tara:strand:- start:38 stop:685 length:648 start_codon:yes stop_codon:yes gene_type:complete